MALLVALAAPLAASCLWGLASSRHGNMWMTGCIFSSCLQVFNMQTCCCRFCKTIILDGSWGLRTLLKTHNFALAGALTTSLAATAIGDQFVQLCRHDVLIIPLRRCSLKYLPCDMWTKWVPDLASNVYKIVPHCQAHRLEDTSSQI